MPRCATRSIWVAVLLGLFVPAAEAHYNMLFPEKASARKGEAVAVTYQWGHPFEHQLFDAPAPEKFVVVAPDGKSTDLVKALEKRSVGEGDKKVTVYRGSFTPQQRGDYLLVLQTPPIWMKEDQEFLQDSVTTVLHVQAQNGWDQVADDLPLQLVPLTRPYGLQPGLVFQAQAQALGTGKNPFENPLLERPVERPGKPLARSLVEIEHYNPAPPKELPPDEQVTRTAKTDPNGVVTCTLTEPGWWCLTVQRDGGKKERDGKSYPVRQRGTFWVFVEGPGAKR
jgi:cobalt/nickel transport protein